MSISDQRKSQLLKIVDELGVEEILPGTLKNISKIEEILDKFLTSDSDLINVKNNVRKLSPTNLPVLIIGESGVGKELLAQALHGNREGKFVAVNCSGIPDTLLEAEFFGCAPGAFTGAINRDGYFEEAKNGTLFLDEIGDMPILLQCKLLRTLQENKIRRIGSNKEIPISCRIISATNKSLNDLQDNSHFRADLFYRLAGHIINIKPLRDRIEDIELICTSFGVSPIIVERELEWRGNVRELINKINEFKILYK